MAAWNNFLCQPIVHSILVFIHCPINGNIPTISLNFFFKSMKMFHRRPVICSAEAPLSGRVAGAESANSRRVVVRRRSPGDRPIFDRKPRHQSVSTNMTTLHRRFVSPTWTQLSRFRPFLQHFSFKILFRRFEREYFDETFTQRWLLKSSTFQLLGP